MTANELRAKNDEALSKELLDLSRAAFNLRMQHGTGQLTRSDQARAVRRDIARVKTIMNERKRQAAVTVTAGGRR
jgi:large subunit ribosomal protein L29